MALLELELERAVSHRVVAGTEAGSFRRASSAFNHHATFPAPTLLFEAASLIGLEVTE